MVATESVTIRVPVGMAKYLSSKNPGYKDYKPMIMQQLPHNKEKSWRYEHA